MTCDATFGVEDFTSAGAGSACATANATFDNDVFAYQCG
jgi:hypothetical protein